MQVSLLQMTSSDQPAENLSVVLDAMNQAKAVGSQMLFTPEVTNCVSLSRAHQEMVLEAWTGNSFIGAVREHAAKIGLAVNLGSIGLKPDMGDGRFANRCVQINALGEIIARYDKIHMFDVTLPDGEVYKESSGYVPGDRAVVASTAIGNLGLTICYDLRFPYLFRTLAQSGAHVISVPSAFAVSTGQAHWHILLRARAIEAGCYIIAAAQSGTHAGSGRKTYGHSLVVDPWGAIVLDAGTQTGLFHASIDLTAVDKARAAVPSLVSDNDFQVVTDPNGY
ncbi:MAG: carbon-nitrogen hydrolase family protein [Planktomarina sp.]